jgi:hypothetical protein
MTTGTPAPHDPRHPTLDARMRASIVAVAATGAVLSAGGLATGGLRTGGSVAAGAAMAAGNLWALARVVVALLPDDADGRESNPRGAAPAGQGKGAWTMLALVKTAGLLVAAWAVLSYRVAAPLPMLVGFVALPIGIAIGAIVSDRRPQP